RGTRDRERRSRFAGPRHEPSSDPTWYPPLLGQKTPPQSSLRSIAPFLPMEVRHAIPHELKEDERNDSEHRYASTNRRSPQPPNRRHVLDGGRIRPFLH